MLKNGYVICPTCGGRVECFDCLDIEDQGDKVVMFKVGECDHCGNHYQWHEEYHYAGYKNVEQTHDESEDEPGNIDDDCGFNPYLGCYTDDC